MLKGLEGGSYQARKGKFEQEEVGGALISSYFSQRDGAWLVSLGFSRCCSWVTQCQHRSFPFANRSCDQRNPRSFGGPLNLSNAPPAPPLFRLPGVDNDFLPPVFLPRGCAVPVLRPFCAGPAICVGKKRGFNLAGRIWEVEVGPRQDCLGRLRKGLDAVVKRGLIAQDIAGRSSMVDYIMICPWRYRLLRGNGCVNAWAIVVDGVSQPHELMLSRDLQNRASRPLHLLAFKTRIRCRIGLKSETFVTASQSGFVAQLIYRTLLTILFSNSPCLHSLMSSLSH